ncbi:ABC transporter ATP-binding protein [Caldalkalibacillus mannanilyticus]|uniref:ABC transporter ATP-binding protein n=1 Tax=Caldalkalibacillus mannanilyticus TaxID=1418 RepID=UPI001F2AE308|nr:ABC transporter ATP-binding protein [Caldalkalibacillus mannanilyticus]
MIELYQLLNFINSKNKKPYFLGILFSSILLALFPLTFAMVMKYLGNFADSGESSLMIKGIILMVAAILLISLFLPVAQLFYVRSVLFTMQEVREKLFAKITKLPLSYIEQHHSGDLLSRMNNDVTALEETFKDHYQSLLVKLCTGSGALLIMFFTHWKFTCIVLATIFVALYINLRFTQQIRNINNRIQMGLGKMTGKFSDLYAGLQLIKMFHIKQIDQQYQALNQDTASRYMQLGQKKGKVESINFLMSYSVFAGIIIYGMILFSSREIELGTVLNLMVLQMMVTQVFLEIGSTFSWIQTSLAGAHRIKELLNEQEEPERLGRSEQITPSEAALELRQLTFSYHRDDPVLINLTMKIPPEQVIAIVGASGSGKSTLMKLLLGFYPIEKGEIFVQGKSFAQLPLQELRKMIAYVPQDAYLFTGTIEQNIQHGNPEATKEAVIKAAQDAFAHDFITQLTDGYQTLLGERGVTLSGGQRQRIAIARALLRNAPILLLDEATSALDNESEYWVQQALERLMQGRTTVIIAHRLSTIEKADQIYVMDQGEIVEQGTHRELLELKGNYAKLYEGQVHMDSA